MICILPTQRERERRMTVLSDSRLPLFGLVLQRPHHVLIGSGISLNLLIDIGLRAGLPRPPRLSLQHPSCFPWLACFLNEAGTLNASCEGDIKRSAIRCENLRAPNVAPDSTSISNLHVTGVVVDTRRE